MRDTMVVNKSVNIISGLALFLAAEIDIATTDNSLANQLFAPL